MTHRNFAAGPAASHRHALLLRSRQVMADVVMLSGAYDMQTAAEAVGECGPCAGAVEWGQVGRPAWAGRCVQNQHCLVTA